MELFKIGLVGLIAEGGGLSLGILLLHFFHIKNGKSMGMLYGATSGLMLAMICFDILPEALNKGRTDLVFCGIVIGCLLGILLDEWVPHLEEQLKERSSGSIARTGLVLALGIAVHNLPEGFALGTMALAAEDSIVSFTIILALHSVPEGIAMAIPFIKAKTSVGKLLFVAMCLGLMMGVGAMIGYQFSGMHEQMISTGLGVAAGIILYIVCGELIPESRKIWNGRLTTIATILGLMSGLLLLSH